ncbi:MAG: universal stress protein [Marinobacter sp.]
MTDLPANHADHGTASGRILVLLDGSRMSYAALEAAAKIAAHSGAEVQGVFVEELNLLRSAGYGFAREVGSVSGVSRPFDVAELERRMQRLADQARRALAGAVGHYGGRYTLSISRGSVVEEVLALAGPEDLLVLGRVGWSSAPGACLGSTATGLLRRSQGRLLLWSEQQVLSQGRIVVFLNDHEDANGRAIKAAADAIGHSRQPVTLLLAADAALSPEALTALKQNLGASDSQIRVQRLPATDPITVVRVLQQERATQLVLSRECALLRASGAEQLLAALNLPVTVTP